MLPVGPERFGFSNVYSEVFEKSLFSFKHYRLLNMQGEQEQCLSGLESYIH